MSFVTGDFEKLLLAAVLGGLIGLEREIKHRPAGLRTNLFICMGAALFTALSDQIAVLHAGDHTRIAAQIIPGIGFIGAGSILHARGDLISGITTASTIFVVASIGMAVGGDQYLIAIFATLLVVGVLLLLGALERIINLKVMVYAYEVAGTAAEQITNEINAALEPLHFFPLNVQVAPTPSHVRVRFECEGTRKQQKALLRGLEQSGKFEIVAALGPVQSE
ncbi:MAG TPA: MgtC/SapB family protein [Terriglobales bacterium]|nr:MgtC/SapB family protein [Terriglobales bacterium]